jgi:AcrR family transcriptional regulator
MEIKATNTEQTILEAAEKLFLEKGYTGTRTTEIAKAANVNHALLHYYFRTKENLFNQIFEEKATELLSFFSTAFEGDYPFFEKLKIVIETHFDYMRKTPELPLFVLREIVSDKEKKESVTGKIFHVAKTILERMTTAIREEMRKGTIRPTKANDLLINIASLNVFSFVAAQLFFDINDESQQEKLSIFFDQRKKNNVELIINSLKI